MTDVTKSIRFDENMLNSVLRDIYEEKVKPSEGEIPVNLYEATRGIFENATAEGFSDSGFDIEGNEDFLKQYTHSIEVFSAFRVHKYSEMLANELHDEDGKLRPFEEWRKATESIQSHFNRSWLETEYNTAVLRAEQAADWKKFERDADIMPNLKWMPTSSASPREEHAVFWRDGLTLPVSDHFWDDHHPGDLWNCKCWLEQTDGKATDKEDMPKKKDMPKPANGLKSNPGKKAEMFDRSHSYYPDPKNCIWLKLARLAKKREAEAKFGKFFNSVKCPGNCNLCEAALKWRFKQDKKVYSKKIKKWASEELKEVKLPDGSTAKRYNVEVESYDIVINKRFMTETFDKYVRSDNLKTAMEICEDVKEWLPKSKFKGIEKGRHHDYSFAIFTTTYKGHKVKAEVRITEANILHVVKVDDEDNYRY